MQQDWDLTLPAMNEDTIGDDRPSARFITAISEYLDTDPKDLLLEHGYYGHSDASLQTAQV